MTVCYWLCRFWCEERNEGIDYPILNSEGRTGCCLLQERSTNHDTLKKLQFNYYATSNCKCLELSGSNCTSGDEHTSRYGNSICFGQIRAAVQTVAGCSNPIKMDRLIRNSSAVSYRVTMRRCWFWDNGRESHVSTFYLPLLPKSLKRILIHQT